MSDFFALEYFINPNKRVFWGYILSSILIACIYFYFNKKQLRLTLSSKLWFHPSAKLDYYYFFIGYFIKVFMLFPIVISAKTIALFINKQLYLAFDFYENSFFSYEAVLLMYTICLFLVSDFTRYWTHRFLHTIPFLWEFHKIHHSAKVLTPITFYRVHPVENLLFGLRYSLSIGLVTGVFIYFFGAMIDIYAILGVNVLVFAFSLIGSNLRHSHVAFSYPKLLERFFISPKQHQVHHSKKYFNKNYGGYLAIWDWVFGTLKFSKDVKVLKFGLRREQMNEYNSIANLIIAPFKNLVGGKR
ncbi:sterol desaturase family protein [Arcobacter roscoffensis]|uniref:Sterol desaturase family protein n=1 Tax=Arcobacter roscoffensis TaxID=2961520 RepID=A0ABY5E672_9BACT|nr:sterol desaturase family protein [Arcobacter roscoffensis]UTJ07221.1 sterol desaturase family protein [Arcobacter roscoffensis]